MTDLPAPAPLIICVATSGALASRAEHPALPYAPQEIADEIVRGAEAGAAMAHVHARTPDGKPTQDVEAFREIVERVQARADIILELSLGSRGFTVEESLAPLALRPAMASFPMEIRNQANGEASNLERGARLLLERSARPSFAVTSLATRDVVLDVIGRGLGGDPPCLVVAPQPGSGMADAARSLLELTAPFQGLAHWWLMKGGPSGAAQYALRAMAIALGGHVRVGFEDRLTRYEDASLAPSNAWYVVEMQRLAGRMGRPVASAAEARRLLQL